MFEFNSDLRGVHCIKDLLEDIALNLILKALDSFLYTIFACLQSSHSFYISTADNRKPHVKRLV